MKYEFCTACDCALYRLKVEKKAKVELSYGLLNFGNCTEAFGVTSFKTTVLRDLEVVCFLRSYYVSMLVKILSDYQGY